MNGVVPSKTNNQNESSINEEIRKFNLNNNLVRHFKKHNQKSLSGTDIDDRRNRYKTPSGIKKHLNDIQEDRNLLIFKSLSPEFFSKAKVLAEKAIKNQMIFLIYGPYEKVRCVLKSRGWIEKKMDEKIPISNQLKPKSSEINLNKKLSGNISNNESELKPFPDQFNAKNQKEDNELIEIASLLVFDATPDFIWSLKMIQIDMKNIKPNQIINHFRNAGSFTTKSGLIKSFNSLRWFEKDPNEVFPRSYIISDEDETNAFLNDYYLTGCLSMLQLTAEIKDPTSDNENEEIINNYDCIDCDINNSKYEIEQVIPSINYDVKEIGYAKRNIDQKYPEMALHYCEMYLKNLKNKNLDHKELMCFSDKNWEEFFENYYNLTFEGYGIECSESIRNKCKELYSVIKETQQYSINGTKNIWIVKPGAKSRGRGISCISKFSELNNILQTNSDHLIIQKYIERPLLVYNTKFDIRQWFLVTSWSPLTIWWYKDSYVRFCSQQFTLNDFNEAVHLSNNSIQYKYHNGPRSKNLPTSNMWEWKELDHYLSENGYANGWNKKILPSMKNIIIDILLCSQEEIEDRKNSFELYGADFMVTEDDLKTWLLEINSSPCMAASTDVTAKLTKFVIEDIIKVILDYPKDNYCDTGQFELLYKQAPFLKSLINYSSELAVIGNGIKKPITNKNIFLNEIRNDKKLIYDESSILKNKLKQIIENSTISSCNERFGESIKPCQYKIHKKCDKENSVIPKVLQTSVDYKQIVKYENQAFTMDSKKVSKDLILSKTEEYLPIISSNILKSIDKFSDNKKTMMPEKKIRTTYSFDNSFMSKLNLLKSSEGNKRIDQLIKAYLPNFSR